MMMGSRTDNGMNLKLNDLPICGREVEVETLNKLFDEGGTKGTVIAIHGKAGSGKSTLIESNRDSWTRKGSLFASGRFNQNRSEPFSGIIDALGNLIDQWSSTNDGMKEIQSFTPKMELDYEVLRSAVPQLSQIYQDKSTTTTTPTTSTNMKMTTAKRPSGISDKKSGDIRRATYQFLCFLCRSSRRVVLFLDDVDQADNISLDFLDRMASSVEGFNGLLIVLSYSKEILTGDDRFSKTLSLYEESTWNFNKIEVKDLDVNGINQIISKVTKREAGETLPLSEVVYQKAGGNSFFVLRFLQLLQDEKLLYYSFDSFKWEWGDISTIERSMNVSDDIADIVAISMRKLKAETLQVLMVASCLGSEIPLNVFSEYINSVHASSSSSSNNHSDEKDEETRVDPLLTLDVDATRLKEILDSCVIAGILGQRHMSKPYTWLHEKLQVAAYAMISDESIRADIHSRLGACLSRMCSSTTGEEWMVYMAADQYNKAFASRHDESHSLYIADLNLRAAKLSISKSAFYPAVEMLRAGSIHLDETTCWVENYNLTLDVYSTLAETNLLVGNHDDAMVVVDKVLANAQRLEDKFRVQQVQLKCVTSGVSRDYGKGLEMTLEMLDDYDQCLPRRPNKMHIFLAKRKLKSLLPDGRIDNVIELPSVVDETYAKIGKLMDFLGYYALHTPDGKYLTKLSAIHALQLACKHGISAGTIRCIFWLGLLLKKQGEFQEACEYVQLAISLCDKLDSIPEETKVFVNASAHGAILCLVRPLHESLEGLLNGSQSSYRIGDTEQGALLGFGYCISYFCVGLPLGPISSDVKSFGDDARQLGVAYSIQVMYDIIRQTTLNLIEEGTSGDNPTILKGDAMDPDEILNKLEGQGRSMTRRDINTFQLVLACIFRDYDMVERMMEAFLAGDDSGTDHMYCRKKLRQAFIGLAALTLGRDKKRPNNNNTNMKKYLLKGKEIINQMKSEVKKGSTNAHPILLMLNAEECPSKNRYDLAITTCGRSGLIHYQAYMCESAGLYFLEQNDEGWGEFYLRRSLELYSDWGALKKVKVMKGKHEFLKTSSPEGGINSKSTSLKGRSRHQTTVKEALVAFTRFSITR